MTKKRSKSSHFRSWNLRIFHIFAWNMTGTVNRLSNELPIHHSSGVITDLLNDCDSPRKMLAVSRPMSEELSSRSQRAVGRRKDTQRISTASLALAQPHTTSSSQWNKPNPERVNKQRESFPLKDHWVSLEASYSQQTPQSSINLYLCCWNNMSGCSVCFFTSPMCSADLTFTFYCTWMIKSNTVTNVSNQHHKTLYYLLHLLLPHMLISSVRPRQHPVWCSTCSCRKLFHLKSSNRKHVEWNGG